MSVTIDQAVAELKTKLLADPHTHLKARGRDEVEAELVRFDRQGLPAHVIVCDPGDDLAAAWDRLALDPKHDLLLVFDTQKWFARGWGLSDAQIQHGLHMAKLDGHEVYSWKIINALEWLGEEAVGHAGATPTKTDDSGGSSFPVLPVVGITGAVTAGLVGLAIVRRQKLAKEGLGKLAEARASAERAYTDVVLACEELPGDARASELQLKASELKRRIDQVVAEVEAKPSLGNDPVPIGKIRQLENELGALRSTVLQKENK